MTESATIYAMLNNHNFTNYLHDNFVFMSPVALICESLGVDQIMEVDSNTHAQQKFNDFFMSPYLRTLNGGE